MGPQAAPNPSAMRALESPANTPHRSNRLTAVGEATSAQFQGAGGTESSGGPSGTSMTPSGGRFTRGRGAGPDFTVGVGRVGRVTLPGSTAAAVNDGITIDGVGGAEALGDGTAEGISTGSAPVA